MGRRWRRSCGCSASCAPTGRGVVVVGGARRRGDGHDGRHPVAHRPRDRPGARGRPAEPRARWRSPSSPPACCAWRSPSRGGSSPAACRSASSYDLRNGMYAHLQSLELGFFDRQQTGQLMSRATVDLQAVRFFLGYGLVFIIQSALTILLAGGGDVRRPAGPGRDLAAPRADRGVRRRRYGRHARPALQEVQQRIAELTADAEENICGVRVVKAFAREDRQLERFRAPVGRVFDQAMVTTRLQAFYNPFIGFLPQLGLAAILFFGGRQVIDGRLTLGEFSAFYAYLLMLLSPMRTLGILLGMSQRATAAGARIFQILDREPRIVAAPGAPAAAARLGARRAARRHAALRGRGARRRCTTSSLDVAAGTTVALVGATGSGKTSLVQLIPRLYDVTAGAVLVDGADVRESTSPRCARRSRWSTTTLPVQRHGRREHRLRARRRDARGDRARRAPRAGPRVHRAPPRRLRHARRRARPDPQRRPAPARGHRPRAAGRSADPHPRRRDVLGRRLDRAGDQGGAARGHGRAHDVRHRPPAVDDLAGRRDRRPRGRDGRRGGHATTSCSSSPTSTARSSRRACPTRSS